MPNSIGGARSESTTVVADAQPDTLFQHLERHPGLLRTAVAYTITHRFLDDMEKVQGLFGRYGLHGTVIEREAHARGLALRQR